MLLALHNVGTKDGVVICLVLAIHHVIVKDHERRK